MCWYSETQVVCLPRICFTVDTYRSPPTLSFLLLLCLLVFTSISHAVTADSSNVPLTAPCILSSFDTAAQVSISVFVFPIPPGLAWQESQGCSILCNIMCPDFHVWAPSGGELFEGEHEKLVVLTQLKENQSSTQQMSDLHTFRIALKRWMCTSASSYFEASQRQAWLTVSKVDL